MNPVSCDECTPGHHPTMALYPQKNGVSMDSLHAPDDQLPLILYKICREMQKAHRIGIMHSDIKMANILVLEEEDSYGAQLIDFNLAGFYYPGYYEPLKKGTPGYYAPEYLFRGNYITLRK